MNYISIKKLGLVILITLSITNSIAFSANDTPSTTPSAGNYTVLAPLPCIEGNGIKCGSGGNGSLQETVTFETYVQYTMNLLIALAAVWAVAMMVWAGIEYMFTNTFSAKKSSLDRFWNAIWGIVLILCSYLIMRTIDPRFVEIPNTLVPTIKLQDRLTTKSGMDLLMEGLDKDIEYFKARDKEIYNSLVELRANIESKRKEIAELEEQLKKTDPNDPKYKQIQVEIQEKKGNLNKSTSTADDISSEKLFNDIIRIKMDDSTLNTPGRIKSLDVAKTEIEKERLNLIQKAANRAGTGYVNTINDKAINENAFIATAKTELLKIDLVLSSIKTNILGNPPLVAGYFYDLNGTFRTADLTVNRKLRETKNQIEQALVSVQNELNTKYPNLKDKDGLQQEITRIENMISETKVLKGLK